jgi:hypothetical protein
MRTVMGVMIDIIRPVYRVSRGEVGRTRLFCKGAENLVVKILEVSVARGGTLGRGRGGCDGRHGMDDWSDDCRHTLLQSKRRPSALAITCPALPTPTHDSFLRKPLWLKGRPRRRSPIPARASPLTPQPRFLTDDDDVWSQNAWDHVPPPADQDATIAASLARQRAAPVPDGDKPKYNARPAKHWFVPNFHFLHIPLGIDLSPTTTGTTFTRQTPQISSRTASGASVFSPPLLTLLQGSSVPSSVLSFSGCTSSSRSSSLQPT